MTDATPPLPGRYATRFGIILTNLGKLAGLVGGINEAVGPARSGAILFWIAIYLGAQAVEDLVAKIIDRALGGTLPTSPPRP